MEQTAKVLRQQLQNAIDQMEESLQFLEGQYRHNCELTIHDANEAISAYDNKSQFSTYGKGIRMGVD